MRPNLRLCLSVWVILLGAHCAGGQQAGASATATAQQEPVQKASGDGAAADPPGVYTVGGGVSKPVALNSVAAHYTKDARKRGIQGNCVIKVVVDAEGMPRDSRVVKSLDPGLDLKAIEAVKKYRFKPGLKDGVPVPVLITVEVRFRLY